MVTSMVTAELSRLTSALSAALVLAGAAAALLLSVFALLVWGPRPPSSICSNSSVLGADVGKPPRKKDQLRGVVLLYLVGKFKYI